MSEASGGAPAAAVGRSLLPGLSWEPASARAVPAAGPAGCRFGLADVAAEDFGGGSYEVVHYPPAACGLAFGPPSLGQVVRFCQEAAARLQLHGHQGRVVFEYGPTPAERANCAVLLGAFLVLCRGWSAGAVAGALPSEARLVFPCSWARPEKAQAPVMSVMDCWDGVELAISRGWLRVGALEAASPGGPGLEAQLADLGISQYRCLALQYDASWLVPAEILVMADPMTTIKDPNPCTCPSFGPPAEVSEEEEGLQPASPVLAESGDGCFWVSERPSMFAAEFGDDGFAVSQKVTRLRRLGESWEETADCETVRGHDLARTSSPCQKSSKSSVHSVCKDYQHAAEFGPEEAARPRALDFISMLLKHGVGLVVRANGSNEPGLSEIGGSYDPAAIREHGIQHLNCFVKDVNGGIPPPELILSFLLEVDSLATKAQSRPAEMNSAPAVVIHCKGGFGRSVVFACMLVIHWYDVPGRALLGWARLARPGAFTVPEQERFLCSFRCREDLHRHVGLVGAAPPSCCGVQ